MSDLFTPAELEQSRSDAESLMVDAGRALRPTGGYELVDGVDVEAADELFVASCKVQTRNLVARESEVGGRTSASVRMELHLPVATDALRVGDLWEITDAHPLSLSVVGQRFRVTAPVAGSLKTARRYEVEVVVS